jgi:hypothetical protein
MQRFLSYCIIILALTSFFPPTHRLFFRFISNYFPSTPTVTEGNKEDVTTRMPTALGAGRCVTVDPRMTYIGDDRGGNLEYNKEFTLRSVGTINTLALQVAGMVGARNDNESVDYHNGFYTNRLYINGHFIDNLNNYCFQEEDKTFRPIRIHLPSHTLRPGINTLMIVAQGPKFGNHDDFALKEIKLLQR